MDLMSRGTGHMPDGRSYSLRLPRDRLYSIFIDNKGIRIESAADQQKVMRDFSALHAYDYKGYWGAQISIKKGKNRIGPAEINNPLSVRGSSDSECEWMSVPTNLGDLIFTPESVSLGEIEIRVPYIFRLRFRD